MFMRTLLLILFSFFTVAAFSQSTDTLELYTGVYKFPEGSVVASAEVVSQGGALLVNSSQGSSPLDRVGKDTFAISAFGGTAYFLRNAEGKVDRVRIEVSNIIMEGVKQTSLLHHNVLFYLQPQKKIIKLPFLPKTQSGC